VSGSPHSKVQGTLVIALGMDWVECWTDLVHMHAHGPTNFFVYKSSLVQLERSKLFLLRATPFDPMEKCKNLSTMPVYNLALLN
jgi:hypothetical protein